MNSSLKVLLNKSAILAGAILPPIGAIAAGWLAWHRILGWRDIALLVGLYVPISMGITIGFHRYLTHRGFSTSPLAKALLLILGSMAIQGSPIDWVANHRKHHALSDRSGDPHSPVEGFFHAHIGWLWNNEPADPDLFARDLVSDRLVVAISRLFPVWLALGLVLPLAIGGWQGFLWGGLVRVFLTHHVTWSVNSVGHTFGRRPFDTKDRSTNQWIVGVLALGEGWHNNHHAFPRSAFHGLRWWEFDASGLVIRLMGRLGLAREIQHVTRADMRIRQARNLAAPAA